MFAALTQLVRASGLAAIIATHNMELADRMDRRVTLRDGKLVDLAWSIALERQDRARRSRATLCLMPRNKPAAVIAAVPVWRRNNVRLDEAPAFPAELLPRPTDIAVGSRALF